VSVASHLERRGAVYYWRRRLPHVVARRLGQRFLVISLRTREHISARYIAAQLDAVFEQMTMSSPDQWISREQLQVFFRKSFRIHQEVIRRTHAGFSETYQVPYDPKGLLGLTEGWAYRLIEKQGVLAVVRPEDREAMHVAGLSAATIDAVGELLKWYTSPKQAAHMRFSAARVLAEIGAAPTNDNVDRALSIYARAKSEAAFQTKPQIEDEFDFAALIEDAKSDVSSIAWKASAPHPAEDPIPVIMRAPSGAISAPVERTIAWPSQPVVTPPTPDRAATSPWIDSSIAVIGEKLVSDRTQDKTWDEKTVRQARMIIDLFSRFIAQERRISDLATLGAADLDAFDGFLRNMGKNYGKSAADKTRSIDDLRKRWAALPATARGLETKTRNKHYFFLNHWLARARQTGVAIASDLSFAGFWVKPKGRARNERAIPKVGVFEQIFEQAIYTGCAGWDDLFAPGPHVFHRAAYFGPMFAHYHGLRREEFCGLKLDDIILDKGPPHIWVQPNDLRTLKNDQSERQLTLHPELLRLGLLDYVEALRAIGETRLFPELASPSSKSPLGDRYYKEWSPGLIKLGFTPHAQRHFFNNALKQKFVASEMRADLMGHGGKGETEERYAGPIELAAQLDLIANIPVVTANLERRPIKLIPWVAKREIAPWSKAAVALRREAAVAARKAKARNSR
jgi:hypothetical protein